jgi:hypothetical protein
MRAMCATESVVHINIAQRRQRLRKRAIVLFFLRMEANVFEQRHSAVAQVRTNFLGWLANAVTGESHRLADQFFQLRRHRTQRIFLHRFALGPAEMRHEDDSRAMFTQIIDGRQSLADARVVRDYLLPVAFFKRHVEVHAHQDAFTF